MKTLKNLVLTTKLLKESPAILKTAVDDLLNDSVNIVLVTGDLTKDGELIT